MISPPVPLASPGVCRVTEFAVMMSDFDLTKIEPPATSVTRFASTLIAEVLVVEELSRVRLPPAVRAAETVMSLHAIDKSPEISIGAPELLKEPVKHVTPMSNPDVEVTPTEVETDPGVCNEMFRFASSVVIADGVRFDVPLVLVYQTPFSHSPPESSVEFEMVISEGRALTVTVSLRDSKPEEVYVIVQTAFRVELTKSRPLKVTKPEELALAA